jgi:hypothetical protein
MGASQLFGEAFTLTMAWHCLIQTRLDSRIPQFENAMQRNEIDHGRI